MQDIHSMAGGGGGGRLFSSTNSGVTGGGGGIDRRLRAHNLHSQALKCPRCDSLNTKFCYYNNYNLSQPRHFCKNCRRYWTKGGVLRNVPVGGGCRKSTKRTSSKTKQPSAATTTETETATATAEEGEKSNSHSSSDSSSLTTTKTTATDAVSSQQHQNSNNISNHNNSLFTFPDSSSKYLFPNDTRSYENQFSCTTMFTEMGSFTNLMNDNLPLPDICNNNTTNSPPCTTTNTLQTGNNLQFEPSTSQWNGPDTNSLLAAPSITVTSGFLDQIDMQQNNNNRSITNEQGFPPFDWHQGGTNGENSGGGGFFDLPSTTVDHAYWNQNQWSDNNDHHNLYLP